MISSSSPPPLLELSDQSLYHQKLYIIEFHCIENGLRDTFEKDAYGNR